MSDAFWNNLPMLMTAMFSGVGAIVAAVAAFWARQSREATKVGNTQAATTAIAAAVDRKSIEKKVDESNSLATQGIAATQATHASTQIVVEYVKGNSNIAPLAHS